MTEEEWQTSAATTSMLETLRGKASQRKLRLFACACCLRFWTEPLNPQITHARQVAEYYADGQVPEEVREAAYSATVDTSLDRFFLLRGTLGHEVAVRDAEYNLSQVVAFAVGELSGDLDTHLVASEGEQSFRVNDPCLLREIFGNPFRPVAIEPAWRTSAVVDLARGVYDDRAFDRLPILADALQDAGCEDADVLDHCRGPGPHARGCWVVDLVLGKE